MLGVAGSDLAPLSHAPQRFRTVKIGDKTLTCSQCGQMFFLVQEAVNLRDIQGIALPTKCQLCSKLKMRREVRA